MNINTDRQRMVCSTYVPSEGPHADDRDVLSVDELVQFCLKMKPKLAARHRDSSLCVTPLIEQLMVDGRLISLRLTEDGRHNALNVRVSSDSQRTIPEQERAAAKEKNASQLRQGRQKEQGYSEEEQLRRGIRALVANGLAFRVYSDAGVTGEYPYDDRALIKRCLQKKADRYAKVFAKVLLDEHSIQRRTAEQVSALREYMNQRVTQIVSMATPPTKERDLYAVDTAELMSGDENVESSPTRRRRGRERTRVHFRQGLTQLLEDVREGRIHTVAASDRSRIVRDADLENEILSLFVKHGVQLRGIIEDIPALDLSDPMMKGVNYLIASINEAKLDEISLSTFRGKVQAVESGKALGNLPWWARRDKDGMAELIPGTDETVRRILSLYLDDFGPHAITTKLLDEGVTVEGKSLTHNHVRAAMFSESITGYKPVFGLAWRVLPVVVDDPDLLAEIRVRRTERLNRFGNNFEMTPWSDHLFTSVLRCHCGSMMSWRSPQAASGVNASEGIYHCRKRNKNHGASLHATVNELQLRQFLAELFRDNPHVLSGILARSLGGSSRGERASRRAAVEMQLMAKKAELDESLAQARLKAEATIRAQFQLAEVPEAFITMVEALAHASVDPLVREVERLRVESAGLQVEASKDRRAETLSASLQRAGSWDNLSITSRNRLLRSLFDRITVFARKGENCIEFRLVGVATPLPRVYLHHYGHSGVRFPTVAEWVEQMFTSTSPSGRPPIEPRMTTKTRRFFYTFLYQRRKHDEGARTIAEMIHKGRKKYLKRAPTRAYLEKFFCEEQGANDVVMKTLNRLWEEYSAEERTRHIAHEEAECLARSQSSSLA